MTCYTVCMQTKISSGAAIIDWLLEGGYEKDCLTTLYGPSGSGKSNICMILVAATPPNKKTIYIDTEGSFSLARLKQITSDWKNILDRSIIFKPTTFQEQQKVFEKVKPIVNKNTHAIIVDSIAMLYRLEIGKNKNIQQVNRQLGIQLAYLTQMARKQHIPVLITNQVYADFQDKEKINMVGGDLLKYASKCLIELKKTLDYRCATLQKHRSIEENRQVKFKIIDAGLEEIE